MKKLFISQPMNGLSDEEILSTREKAKTFVEEKLGEEVEVIDSFIKDAPKKAPPLWWLGKSLELMAEADIVYFCKGWKKARGCRIEHLSAHEYGYNIMM